MDDSNTLIGHKAADKTDSQTSFGMSSFGTKEREQFGQRVRLAMACIEGTAVPDTTPAMPSDESEICARLKTIAQEQSSQLADFLELLVRFDELEGWKHRGAAHCAAWVNSELGVSPQLGWAYLRAGRQLRSLPTTRALFRAGKLSWSRFAALPVWQTRTLKKRCAMPLWMPPIPTSNCCVPPIDGKTMMNKTRATTIERSSNGMHEV